MQLGIIAAAIDANPGYGDRGLGIAGKGRRPDIGIADITGTIKATGLRYLDTQRFSNSHEVFLAVDKVNDFQRLVVTSETAFVQADAIVVRADIVPERLNIRVQLDNVPGFGKP